MACYPRIVSLYALLLLCTAGLGGALVIEDASREIDLSNARVIYNTKLKIKNDGKSAVDSVTVCLPAALQSHAAFIDAFEAPESDEGEGVAIKAASDWTAPSGGPSDVRCADFSLASALATGKSTIVTVKSVMTQVIRPRPAEIKQGEKGRAYYVDSAHVVSPYKVKQDSAVVVLGNGRLEKHTAPSPASFESKKLALGPYSNIVPFTKANFSVHYQLDIPYLVATSVIREISISHWGNVFIQERYNIRNAGPKLVGEWSRLELFKSEQAGKGAAHQLPAVLPRDARWMYFRDDIGNISTSIIQRSGSYVHAALIPRYPLFGGWSTEFIFGYSLPLGSAVFRQANDGNYILMTSVLPSVKEVIIEELEVRIVLPEGAGSPRVSVKLPAEQSTDHKYTYFDVTGREVLVLRMRNVVQESAHDLIVTYTYSNFALIRKPLVLTAALAIVYAAIVLLSGGSSATGKSGEKSATTKPHTS